MSAKPISIIFSPRQACIGILGRGRLSAWQVDGFLMACWLALQKDVHSVVFIPSDVEYQLERGTMEMEFQRFLDVNEAWNPKTSASANLSL